MQGEKGRSTKQQRSSLFWLTPQMPVTFSTWPTWSQEKGPESSSPMRGVGINLHKHLSYHWLSFKVCVSKNLELGLELGLRSLGALREFVGIPVVLQLLCRKASPDRKLQGQQQQQHHSAEFVVCWKSTLPLIHYSVMWMKSHLIYLINILDDILVWYLLFLHNIIFHTLYADYSPLIQMGDLITVI